MMGIAAHGSGGMEDAHEEKQSTVLNKQSLVEANVNFDAEAEDLNKRLLEVYAERVPVHVPKILRDEKKEFDIDVYEIIPKVFYNGLGVDMKLAGYHIIKRHDIGVGFLKMADLEKAICSYMERTDSEMKKKGLRTNYDKASASEEVRKAIRKLKEDLNRMYI